MLTLAKRLNRKRAMTRYLTFIGLGFLLTGCLQGPDSPRGFSLPEGDEAAGLQVYSKYQCASCHTLAGYESKEMNPLLTEKVPLGGKVSEVTTYGKLVTSIINPSHRLTKRLSRDKTSDSSGNSKMQNFNQQMTVQELIDLVTFLQPKYELIIHTKTQYEFYDMNE